MRLRILAARLRDALAGRFIPAADLRAALLLAWLALSAAAGVAALAALTAPEQAVLEAAARCETPGGHRQACALCGMTHAFLALRKGRFREAGEANAASLLLFPSLALNEALAGIVLVLRMKRGWQTRVRPAIVRNPG
jgi:hypothetical protein